MTPLMDNFGWRALFDSLAKPPLDAGLSRTLATNLPSLFPSLWVRFACGFIIIPALSSSLPVLFHTDISPNKIPEHLNLLCHLLFEGLCDIHICY